MKITPLLFTLVPLLAVSCQGQPRRELRYSAELDAELIVPGEHRTEKVKFLLTDPQGIREVEQWIDQSFRFVEPTGLPYAIMPRGMLFISEPKDLKFEADPARKYSLFITYKTLQGIEKEDFDVLVNIFRKYGQPYSGAFKYEYLWEVRSIEFQAWCPTCKKAIGVPTATGEEVEAISKDHEQQTGHSCRLRKYKLAEPLINKY